MSHLQGTDYVGSMVVLEDGLVKRSDYRRFKVKTVPGNDDYAAMEEVLTRRLTALKEPTEVPADGRPRRFAYRPNLLWSTGARGSSGWPSGWCVSSVSRTRWSWPRWPSSSRRSTAPARPTRAAAAGSDALYLLQRLRDEAHRFAITFHRERGASG
jgi:excinuclease ABC subunit C